MPADASNGAPAIQRLHAVTESQLQGLAALLIDCVDGGASVSFMHPLPLATALDFWRGVAAAATQGKRALLVAEDAKLGWQRCGVIPGYALLPRGGLCDTTYFYRTLA